MDSKSGIAHHGWNIHVQKENHPWQHTTTLYIITVMASLKTLQNYLFLIVFKTKFNYNCSNGNTDVMGQMKLLKYIYIYKCTIKISIM